MRNVFKQIGIIAFVAVIGFGLAALSLTGCGGGGGGDSGGNSGGIMTWTAVANSTFGTSYIYAIAYGNGTFVAGGSSGKMATSTDN